MDSVIRPTASEHTTRHAVVQFDLFGFYCVQHRSFWMRRILGQKIWSTRHNAVRHDGQLVMTRFYGVTSWPCDELTGSWGWRREVGSWVVGVPTCRHNHSHTLPLQDVIKLQPSPTTRYFCCHRQQRLSIKTPVSYYQSRWSYRFQSSN